MHCEARIMLALGVGLALTGCFTSSDGTNNTDAGPPLPGVDAGDAAVEAGVIVEAGAIEDASRDATHDGGMPVGDGPVVMCTPSGAPVTHSADITADEVWASGIHLVPSTIQIKNSARLTIDPCSEVRLGPGASIVATTSSAGLDAVGTSASPIRFIQQQAGMPWGTIRVTSPAVGNLAYVTLSGGGTGPHASSALGGASLAANDSNPDRAVALRLQHVVITGSAGLGIFLQGARFDPASTDLTITGAGWYPVYLGAASAGDLPTGSYTGNAIDQILLQTFGVAAYDDAATITSDVTFKDLGVPYRVGTSPSSIVVGDGQSGHPLASLTLAAGVKVLFTPQGTSGTSRILVNAQDNNGTPAPQGALITQGTTAAPVVLDSAADTPAAGDWEGLYFANLVDSRTSIVHARISNAGGFSGSVGICGSTPAANHGDATCAIIVFVKTPPPAFLSQSEIESAPCGVYRNWSMTDVDFVSSNQFVAVPGCTQTSLPAADNSCVPCSTSP
jgi:hypothetical protein